MLKAAGAFVVLSGCGGLVYAWMQQQLERQKTLRELLHFFMQAGYAMQSRKMQLLPFFITYQTSHPVLKEVMQQMAEQIQERGYPNGEALWKAVWMKHQRELDLSGEEWMLLMESGGVFFGMHLEENISHGMIVQKQIQDFLEQEIHDFKEKQKIAVPLGLFCGLFLILVLI